MKTKIYSIVIAVVMTVFAFSPLLNNNAYAISCPTGTNPPLVASGNLCLPQGQGTNTSTTAGGLILQAINILLTLAAAVAVLFLVIGGFQYITSAGNEETAKKGRATVVNALIGLVIIILSFAIVSIVNNTISNGCGFGSFLGFGGSC
jgi:hypothetical protein